MLLPWPVHNCHRIMKMLHTCISRTTACSSWFFPRFHSPQHTFPIWFITRIDINTCIIVILFLSCAVCCIDYWNFLFWWLSFWLVISLVLSFIFPIGDVPSLLSSGYARDNVVVVIVTIYTWCGYWLHSHMTTGVGAQTPYSMCPPPKKVTSSSPQRKEMQNNK